MLSLRGFGYPGWCEEAIFAPDDSLFATIRTVVDACRLNPNDPLGGRSPIYRAIVDGDRAMNCAPTRARGSNDYPGLRKRKQQSGYARPVNHAIVMNYVKPVKTIG